MDFLILLGCSPAVLAKNDPDVWNLASLHQCFEFHHALVAFLYYKAYFYSIRIWLCRIQVFCARVLTIRSWESSQYVDEM
jgi:hypothetical protein